MAQSCSRIYNRGFAMKQSTLTAAALASAALAPAALADASQPTADEVRAIVSEMLADAETRSSLQSSSGNAGHDGRFFLASPGGDFRRHVGG